MQLLGSRYRLAEPLGTGGMSVVWRGYDELLGRRVAVKVLARDQADAASFAGRIRQEAMASARISHPNIAGVYDYGEAADPAGGRVPYMVMELVEGTSLASRLADGPLPWREAVRVCAEVADALVASHEMGLVHRDLSPANVLLAPTGAKLIDFGISAPVGEPERKVPRLGTPAYIAPERFTSGGLVHPAADVYALGVLLYHTLTGTLPWPADSIPELLTRQRYVAPAPLPPVPDLPAKVPDLVARCLARQPDKRPASRYLATRLAALVGRRMAVSVSADPPHARPAPPVPEKALPGKALPEIARPEKALPGKARPTRPAAAQPLTMAMTAPRRFRRSRRVVVLSLAALTLVGAGAAAEIVTARGNANRAVAAPPSAAPNSAAPTQAPPSRQDPPAQAGCAVAYRVRSTWIAGFTADVRVTNTGGVGVSDWTLTFALTGDQRILQGWNGVFGQAGPDVTVADAGYNGKLPPGRSTTVGFNGSYRRRNPAPARFRLNGVPCSVNTD